ncbi:MAG: SDR family NAD(P)-dependent oxidoreductase, partial [Gammaproteobacteria bacterium]
MNTQPRILMKKLNHLFAAALGLGAASMASAGVIQGFGANAVDVRTNFASFDANLPLANDYVEDGLLFHFSGSGANNGCGYAGANCYDDPSELGAGFAGNYMASAGNNASISVRRTDGSTFHAIEWAAGTGYLTLNGYWQTMRNGAITASGNFSAAGGAVYAMSKSALTGLAKGLARDLGPRGITVNNVQPGPVDTDMNPEAGDFA